MKNKLFKNLSIILSLSITLAFVAIFTIQKSFQYAKYSELYTLVLIEQLDKIKKGSKKKFIDNKISMNIDLINHEPSIKQMFKTKELKYTILYILFFSPKNAICVENRDFFSKSKNKEILEYMLKNCKVK